jgi:hypothetical protein
MEDHKEHCTTFVNRVAHTAKTFLAMWQNAQRDLAVCIMIQPASRTDAGKFRHQDQGTPP